MICKQCGYNNDENNILCDACGSQLKEIKTPQKEITQNTYNSTYYDKQEQYNPYASVVQRTQPSDYGTAQYYQNTYGNTQYNNSQYGNIPVTNSYSMTFHMIFCIYMFFTAFSSLSTIFSALSLENGFFTALIGLANTAFLVSMAITLLMKKKLGYILRAIYNIFNMVSSACGCLLSIGIIALTFIDPTFFNAGEDSLNGLMIVIGIIFFIFCAGIFVVNLLINNYYKKRKDVFTN